MLSHEIKKASTTRNYVHGEARIGAICVEMMNINTRKIPNFSRVANGSTIKQDDFLNTYL